ncbi:hypothetical protein OPKNFCMD_5477 [Methylobacterium crusticola]|uniref:Uncharacterized protein n=1 Tax=Methylobacterium crusticola TaxID=1697972 RepID=A0ABQ4R4U4_9HYPH|nr:hypothetical protein OPKNFCMD_5477 [Methylobacterium crusticola]
MPAMLFTTFLALTVLVALAMAAVVAVVVWVDRP